jgi:Fe2+ transport system protein B
MNNNLEFNDGVYVNDNAVSKSFVSNVFAYMSLALAISGALAYLIFIMMYAPCASVIGAMIQEAGAKWAWISFLWPAWMRQNIYDQSHCKNAGSPHY